MPTYCAYTDLQYLTGSTLSQTILEAIITQAETKLDRLLAEKGLTGSGGNATLKAAALEFSMVGLYERYRLDGTQPGSVSVGDLSMSSNVDQAIALHNAEGLRLLDAYVATAASASTEDAEETVTRQDHQMESLHLDQAVVNEYHDRATEYGTEDDEVN